MATIKPSVRSFHDLARVQPNDRVADVLVLLPRAKAKPAGSGRFPCGPARSEIPPLYSQGSIAGNHALSTALRWRRRLHRHSVQSRCRNERAEHVELLSPVDGHIVLEIATELQRISALHIVRKPAIYMRLPFSRQAAGVVSHR